MNNCLVMTNVGSDCKAAGLVKVGHVEDAGPLRVTVPLLFPF